MDIPAYATRALPPLEGQIKVTGLRERVEVLRDRWGVPSIYASNLEDLYFAQGFVTAQDRLYQFETTVRHALGRSAELLGADAAATDVWTRQLGLHKIAERLAADPDDLSVTIATSYLSGVKAWVERMPCRPLEYEIVDADPWVPDAGDDSAALLAGVWMGGSFMNEFEHELLRVALVQAVGPDAALDLMPPMAAEPHIVTSGKRPSFPAELLGPLEGQGSNNWVVDGSRSATGKPLLANDPHQPFQVPQMFYEVHLVAPGINARGVTFPHVPGIIIGHAPTYGWAVTAVAGDQADLCIERLNEDGTAALWDGEWLPVTTRTETVAVRGEPDRTFVVRETRNGPLLDHAPPTWPKVPGPLYSVRWAPHLAVHRVSTTHRMSTATDFASFCDALRWWPTNPINAMYAGADGEIGYHVAGAFPERKRGDGTIPVPGWDPAWDWDGLIPFDELPQTHNPDVGFIVTANNRQFDDAYPHNIGRDQSPPYRARRATELITATELHTIETYATMHGDTVSPFARELLPLLCALESPEHDGGLKLLREWDGDVRADLPAACIYEVWVKHLGLASLEPALGTELAHALVARRGCRHLLVILRFPTARWFGSDGAAARDVVMRTSLDAALTELREALGDDMSVWRWGDLHQVKLVHPMAERAEEHRDYMTVGIFPQAGDSLTLSPGAYVTGANYDPFAGACWRQIIDLNDIDASIGVGLTGQSSNPASPHFADQAPLRFSGAYRPLPVSRPAVERLAAHTLVLEASA